MQAPAAIAKRHNRPGGSRRSTCHIQANTHAALASVSRAGQITSCSSVNQGDGSRRTSVRIRKTLMPMIAVVPSSTPATR